MAVYKERTYLTPLIRWIGLAVVAAIMLTSLLAATVFNDGNDQELIGTLVGVIGGFIGIVVFLVLRLDLKLTGDAVDYQMFPLEWRTKRIRADEITAIEVRKFTIFPKYGGFGRRRKPWKKEVAYILNRDHGLYIQLKDGRTRIFSTSQPAKLRQFLRANYSEIFKTDLNEKV
jgi:hypothetical protein